MEVDDDHFVFRGGGRSNEGPELFFIHPVDWVALNSKPHAFSQVQKLSEGNTSTPDDIKVDVTAQHLLMPPGGAGGWRVGGMDWERVGGWGR